MTGTRPTLLAVILAALCVAGPSAPEALAGPQSCTECHTDVAESGHGKFALKEYAAGVHAKVECTQCHRRPEGSFDAVPHTKTEPDLTACLGCHGINLKEFKVELKSGVHGDLKCGECHDAHAMVRRDTPDSDARTRIANAACIRCHGPQDLRGEGKAHEWLPDRARHARMRCMACHAPLTVEHDHEIVPSVQATRDCEACHKQDTALIAKYAGKDDRSTWVTNPLLFEKAYVPGATRNVLVDRIVLAIFGLTIVGALGHGLLRLAARARRKEEPFEVATTVLYAPGLRLWHWTNALLMLALAVTGMRLHFGGREKPVLTFEQAFDVHNVVGVAMVLLTVVFFVRAVRTGDAKQYLGRPEDGVAGILRQVGYYLGGIFRGADHPYHATPERRFNPLQQVTYASIMYGLVPVISLSGIVLLFPQVLPERIAGRPAGWWFATAHYLSGAGMVAFLLGHLYLTTTGDRLSYLISAMITGRHRHHVRKAPPASDG
jgi:thiosulfate reductase cytochrome b subunit